MSFIKTSTSAIPGLFLPFKFSTSIKSYKQLYYTGFILLCFAMMFFSKSYSQSSADFSGRWVGYMKIDHVPVYRLSINITDVESKAMRASVNIYDYADDQKLIKSENAVLTYDKQTKIAYYSTFIPNTTGMQCGGWIILKIEKDNKDSLNFRYRTPKRCMEESTVMAREAVLKNDPVYAVKKEASPKENAATAVVNNPGPTQKAAEIIAVAAAPVAEIKTVTVSPAIEPEVKKADTPTFKKSIKIAWRQLGLNTFDPDMKGRKAPIVMVNDAYFKTIPEAEKAAIAYAATFLGNDCWYTRKDWWNDNTGTGLKCKILSSLNLGNQCSTTHLAFLRKWFAKDKATFEKLQSCPTIPYTASMQPWLSTMSLISQGNFIIVTYDYEDINAKEGDPVKSRATISFERSAGGLKVLKQEEAVTGQ